MFSNLDYKLAIFDFDYTLINANSNNYLNKIVIEFERDEINNQTNRTPSIADLNRFKYSNEIECLKNEQNLIKRYQSVYKYMHTKYGIGREKMEKCLKDIKINDSMRNLISKLKKSGFDLIIVSDSNTFLIETILKHNNLLTYFNNDEKIIANKALFRSNGQLELIPLNEIFNPNKEFFNCKTKMCRENICKGFLIENYLKLNKINLESDKFLIYVGDGKIDYCPGLRLNSNDIFFVKKNSSLSRLIEEPIHRDKLKSRVKYWKNANDILNELGCSVN